MKFTIRVTVVDRFLRIFGWMLVEIRHKPDDPMKRIYWLMPIRTWNRKYAGRKVKAA